MTVALSGDGGDELFAGYNRHAWLERLWRHGSLLPGPVRRAAGSALERIPPALIDGVAGMTSALPVRWQVRNPATKVAKVGKVLAASGRAGCLSLLGVLLGRGRVHGHRRRTTARCLPGSRDGRRLSGTPSRCCGWTWSATFPTTS